MVEGRRLHGELEDPIVAAFRYRLEQDGWTVTVSRRGHNDPDIDARRGSERLIAEVKGRSLKDRGTALDIAYGQLLRRMRDDCARARFAIVVPRHAMKVAERVSASVRARLGIEVFVVDDDGHVTPDP